MDDILKKLNTLAANQGIPLNATFELTPRCNMRCKMCYIHRPECLPKQLPLRPMTFWLDMARQAKELGTMVLVITGGETFLYPEAETLLEQLMQMGFIISLNTNGTLLDHRRIAWLNEHPLRRSTSLSTALPMRLTDGFAASMTAFPSLRLPSIHSSPTVTMSI